MVKIYSIALFLLLGFMPLSANAATLSFGEPANVYAVGSTFTVTAYVDSADQAMNAVSGVVSFPWNTLEVVSISKTGSIFSLFVQEPSFSNSAGTIGFEGVVLNPGWKGTNGKILTVTFRAKAAGQANLSFSSGSVLANDGTGMSILNGLRVAIINISAKTSVPSVSREEAVLDKNAPLIISPTHPEQTKWYRNSSPEFSWALPEGALEVRILINTLPKSVPTVRYIKPILNKKIDALPDGTHYFHLQIRTKAGWGSVAHYTVNIDTTPPKPFSITFPHGTKGFEPQPVIFFNTTDSESGVSYYDVKIGARGLERVAPVAISNPYPLPPQYPGEHVVTVTAYDLAGNSANAVADFTIEAIEAPVITFYSKEINSGDIAEISGTTYKNADIAIVVMEDNRVVMEKSTRSNSLGDFTSIITKRLSPGVYTFTARVTDGRGARSNETAPLIITVKSSFLADFMTSLLAYLSLVTLALLAILGSTIAGLIIHRRLSRMISRLRREGAEAEEVLIKSFDKLRGDIDMHIALLKEVRSKRQFTKEEIFFLDEFRNNLIETEKHIAKEIRDISREI